MGVEYKEVKKVRSVPFSLQSSPSTSREEEGFPWTRSSLFRSSYPKS